MIRNFAFKKDGSYWSIWTRQTDLKVCDGMQFTDFYPLPTIKFSYNKDTFEGEYDFNIDFVWLLWEFKITKYWGEAYRSAKMRREGLK